MQYLYGSKIARPTTLVATFDSDQQLRAYVRWASLGKVGPAQKFEQGSALVGMQGWSSSPASQTDEDETQVPHNPSPSML